jgi:FPC/CPF motif-containing protein YcgG
MQKAPTRMAAGDDFDLELSEVRAALGELLMGDAFSCIGGRAAWKRGFAVHNHYGQLAGKLDCAPLYADLEDFAKRLDSVDSLFTTFLATFSGPCNISENEFEELLWCQLRMLHEADARRYAWASGAGTDPMADNFAYSIAGRRFFVVGIHSNSARLTRRFAWPVLVFNPHDKFDKLREAGAFERIRRITRKREMDLQGSLNPRLIMFGYRPESMRYSGRVVEADWRCPVSFGLNSDSVKLTSEELT